MMTTSVFKPMFIKNFFDMIRIVDSLTKNGYAVCVEYCNGGEDNDSGYEISYRLSE